MGTVLSREVFVLDGYIRSMRFAVSLFVIAVGAIFAFGVADSPDDSVRVHLIALGSPALARPARRGASLRHGARCGYCPRSAVGRGCEGPRRPPVHRRELLPAASIVRDPQTGRVARVHGVMDVEPGSAEFRRMAELYEE